LSAESLAELFQALDGKEMDERTFLDAHLLGRDQHCIGGVTKAAASDASEHASASNDDAASITQ
jgi:hypothetical protein